MGGPEISSELIYEAFRKFLIKHLRPVDDVVHVSELVNCLRKAYYTRIYGDPELKYMTPTKRVVLGLGLSVHLVLEEILKELGFQVEKQIVREVNGVKIAGTPDAMNDNLIVEVKTVKKIPSEPLIPHYLQVNCYMGLTEIKNAYIIYINKVEGFIAIYPVVFLSLIHI